MRDHILNRFTAAEVIFLGVLIGALAFANFALFMFREGITLTVQSAETSEHAILYARGTTISYLTIAYCQFANILSRRYERTTILNRNFWTNRVLLFSIVGSIGLIFLGVYGPGISDFLRFARLSLADWLHVLGAAGVFLAAFEILKFGKRLAARRSVKAAEPRGSTAVRAG